MKLEQLKMNYNNRRVRNFTLNVCIITIIVMTGCSGEKQSKGQAKIEIQERILDDTDKRNDLIKDKVEEFPKLEIERIIHDASNLDSSLDVINKRNKKILANLDTSGLNISLLTGTYYTNAEVEHPEFDWQFHYYNILEIRSKDSIYFYGCSPEGDEGIYWFGSKVDVISHGSSMIFFSLDNIRLKNIEVTPENIDSLKPEHRAGFAVLSPSKFLVKKISEDSIEFRCFGKRCYYACIDTIMTMSRIEDIVH